MPHDQLNLTEAARYLHLAQVKVEQLMRRREIPFTVSGSRVVFLKHELDAWASRRIMEFDGRQLQDYHGNSHRGTMKVADSQPLLRNLLAIRQVTADLAAKTRASVLREVVRLADRTGWLIYPKDLLASLEAREELCSTALPGGLALLHPCHHDEYLFEQSFLLLARTVRPVPFNAPDGKCTDLFFLLCCRDDCLHLHLLSRLCMMCTKTGLLDKLRDAPDAAAMVAAMTETETEIVKTINRSHG